MLIGFFRKNFFKALIELVVDFAIAMAAVFALNFILPLGGSIEFLLIGVGTIAMFIGSIISHLDKSGLPAQ